MQGRTILSCVALFIVGCNAPSSEAGSSGAPKPAKAASAGAPAGEPSGDEAKPETPEATSFEREWLVWWGEGDGFVTRWVGTTGEKVETVAERKALVHASGGRVFELRRKDQRREVSSCGCMEEDFGPCEEGGIVDDPGLVAVDLEKGDAVPLVTPDEEGLVGEVYGLSLQVVGGAGDQIVLRQSDSGFYCGAHQSIDGGDSFVHVAEGQGVEWPKLELDADVRHAAAKGEMIELYRDCLDDKVSLERFADEVMELATVSVGLREGEVEITWGFEAPVDYACSPDYTTYGEARTKLVPAAASLGLGPDMPEGLSKALAELGTKPTLGWSELKLGERRASVLEAFGKVSEDPWPDADQSQRNAEPGPEAAKLAKEKLAEGRKLTRSGDYAGAIESFSLAIEAQPDHARAWAGRGYARLLNHELRAAQTDCEKALTLSDAEGFQASVHYNLGQIHEKQGDEAAAKKAYRRSVELRPHDEVQKALDALGG